MRLSLAFSPCPNDTFIFDALVNGHIDTEGLEFTVSLFDVEALNQKAIKHEFDISKVSYGVLPKIISHYQVVDSGSALGRGVGPLLVSVEPINFDLLTSNGGIVALPGENTTAHRLFCLAFPQVKRKLFVRFDEIEDLILTRKVAAGVLIHENRFTYETRGLIKWMDLGQNWEEKTGAPIPLGGIVVDRALPEAIKQKIDRVIRKSIEWAFNYYIHNPAPLSTFIQSHAQEMDPSVMRKHIDLYVNNYSISLGADGRAAIKTLLEAAAPEENIELTRGIFVGC